MQDGAKEAQHGCNNINAAVYFKLSMLGKNKKEGRPSLGSCRLSYEHPKSIFFSK